MSADDRRSCAAAGGVPAFFRYDATTVALRQHPKTTWHELVEIARFAPSPHNTQPWKLHINDDRSAMLSMVRARTLPDEDRTGCFLICAMGIFIESLRIVAANAGWRLTSESIAFNPTSNDDLLPFANLTLDRDALVQERFTNEVFLRRCTSRLPASATPVDAQTIVELQQVAAAGGLSFRHTADPLQIARILQKNTDAVFHDLNDRRYHDEIIQWFRYGLRHEQRTRDGLASRCMNMTALELYFTANFPWTMKAPGLRRLMRKLYRFRLGGATQMGWLAGDFWNRAAAERAGRTLLRLWLAMTEHHISMHPFGNLVTNPAAHEWLTHELDQQGIWIVFRFGHLPVCGARRTAPPRSLRLQTQEIIDDA